MWQHLGHLQQDPWGCCSSLCRLELLLTCVICHTLVLALMSLH